MTSSLTSPHLAARTLHPVVRLLILEDQMPIYKCEKCGKVHRTEDDVCCQSDQLAESKPGGVSANGDGSLSCAPQATNGNEVNRQFDRKTLS